jgi:hypothetical protein
MHTPVNNTEEGSWDDELQVPTLLLLLLLLLLR